jgi:hypothetical protein
MRERVAAIGGTLSVEYNGPVNLDSKIEPVKVESGHEHQASFHG